MPRCSDPGHRRSDAFVILGGEEGNVVVAVGDHEERHLGSGQYFSSTTRDPASPKLCRPSRPRRPPWPDRARRRRLFSGCEAIGLTTRASPNSPDRIADNASAAGGAHAVTRGRTPWRCMKSFANALLVSSCAAPRVGLEHAGLGLESISEPCFRAGLPVQRRRRFVRDRRAESRRRCPTGRPARSRRLAQSRRCLGRR